MADMELPIYELTNVEKTDNDKYKYKCPNPLLLTDQCPTYIDNYMGLSIFSLFCCFFIGFMAVFRSSECHI